MNTIKDRLKENRPTLSESSLKTYTSILWNLYKKVFPDTTLDLEKFSNHKKFLNYLKDTDGSKRKTYLSSLVVISPSTEEYRTLMNKDGQEYNSMKKLQKKSDKQEENWVDQTELTTIYNALEEEAKRIFKMKNPTPTDLQTAQNYIILSLVSGKHITIRRSLDWTEMKWKNYSVTEDNFLERGKKSWKFVFNVYKTQKFLGDQEVIVPKELKKIVNSWLKLLESVYPDTDYLLVDSKGNKLTPTKITQRLNNVFGKKASISILRHSFLSEKYKNLPSIAELETEATEMGHSLKEHMLYILKDDEETKSK